MQTTIFFIQLLLVVTLVSASLDRITFLCNQLNTPYSLDECNYDLEYFCGVTNFNELKDDTQTLQTFINECYACFNLEVSFLRRGSCEVYPKNARLCHPRIEDTVFCEEDLSEPVCGYFQLLQEEQQSGQTSFQNACKACETAGLVYYLPGRCKGDIRE